MADSVTNVVAVVIVFPGGTVLEGIITGCEYDYVYVQAPNQMPIKVRFSEMRSMTVIG